MSKFDGILSAKSNEDSKFKQKTTETSFKTEKKEASKRIGKRSHPDFAQVTAYIKKKTHEEVMRKIYKRQEFSELLEELLTEWLKKP